MDAESIAPAVRVEEASGARRRGEEEGRVRAVCGS